ncbi:hypothetical protein ACH4HG_29165 [Streptomyces coeruleorubidus]|uniref:Uncharacterized protein n=1 Tax=Streptomyces coeruleorubidus TaxID=116188 RepID=A0ABZ0KQM4_STRC4|nr:hypothetical protein [Streptomyces coeruleorubidus]WOT40131.1 hypothetical protein R5U08_41155 [Streptomyces coeruleorubidus]
MRLVAGVRVDEGRVVGRAGGAAALQRGRIAGPPAWTRRAGSS